jgi:hypothetical protein
MQSGMPTMTSKPAGGPSGFKQVGASEQGSSAGFKTVGSDKPSGGGFKTVGQASNSGGGWAKVGGSSTSAAAPTHSTSAPNFRSGGFTTLATTSSSLASHPPSPSAVVPPPPPSAATIPPSPPPLSDFPRPPPPPAASAPPPPPPPPPPSNSTPLKGFQGKGWSTVGSRAGTASTSTSFRPSSSTSVPRPDEWVPQGAQPLHPMLASEVPTAASGGKGQSGNVFGDDAMDEDQPSQAPQQRAKGNFKSSSGDWRGGPKLGKGRGR